jgi:hypothetical protein
LNPAKLSSSEKRKRLSHNPIETIEKCMNQNLNYNSQPSLPTNVSSLSSSGPQAPAIRTMQEWITLELSTSEREFVIGSQDNALVRPKTKNLIEAAEKSFKTSFLLRLLAGLSSGETVYPDLPVGRPRRVLYLHGELSNAEIKDRTVAAATSLVSQTFENFWQGRVLDVHLIEAEGQGKLRELIDTYKPDDVALDPWQAFIIGSEENGYKDMSEATQFCSELIERYGVTLWIPIHLGKDRSKGARGHSVLAGWRDTRIQLKRDSSSLTVTVDPRWGTPPDPFKLRFRGGTLWPDTEAEFRGQAAEVRQYVEDHGGRVSLSDLEAHLKPPSPDAFRKALSRAREQGAIIKSADYVSLPIRPSPEAEDSIQ